MGGGERGDARMGSGGGGTQRRTDTYAPHLHSTHSSTDVHCSGVVQQQLQRSRGFHLPSLRSCIGPCVGRRCDESSEEACGHRSVAAPAPTNYWLSSECTTDTQPH